MIYTQRPHGETSFRHLSASIIIILEEIIKNDYLSEIILAPLTPDKLENNYDGNPNDEDENEDDIMYDVEVYTGYKDGEDNLWFKKHKKENDPDPKWVPFTNDMLIQRKIFPVPFPTELFNKEEVQIRVFFGKGNIEKRVLSENLLCFQIYTHHNLWLYSEEDKHGDKTKLLRPYIIINEIIKMFDGKSLGELGIIHFDKSTLRIPPGHYPTYRYIFVNDDYGFYELYGEVMGI